jgi:hypothetical protein
MAMREDHRDVFFKTADKCGCWIGVREPNPLADNWIGKAGYVPKGLSCKAKTADLMAISRSNERGEMLFTDQAQQAELYATVEPLLRQGLGVPMVQHPTEFMWDKGVGAREFEYVLWFGPARRFNRSPSSMPKGGH